MAPPPAMLVLLSASIANVCWPDVLVQLNVHGVVALHACRCPVVAPSMNSVAYVVPTETYAGLRFVLDVVEDAALSTMLKVPVALVADDPPFEGTTADGTAGDEPPLPPPEHAASATTTTSNTNLPMRMSRFSSDLVFTARP
jgi:hypothetical protein